MFVVCNRIPVNPEHAQAFEAAFAQRAGLVDQMPGFIAYQLLRPTTEGAPYVVMTTWESAAHFHAWTQSPDFQQGHARSGTLPKETFLGRPVLETFEIIS
ncbi:MAG: antibiotic biosynthesis monooxygenase [Phototrophicales bacterium]|nr:MAG: antibiotic biosynthesis monooxygenase [Phototrophicales bacterium]RMG76159.1 MAG: antibiotic biosynthesis monooxygenase [Chloroflexota bacterium]